MEEDWLELESIRRNKVSRDRDNRHAKHWLIRTPPMERLGQPRPVRPWGSRGLVDRVPSPVSRDAIPLLFQPVCCSHALLCPTTRASHRMHAAHGDVRYHTASGLSRAVLLRSSPLSAHAQRSPSVSRCVPRRRGSPPRAYPFMPGPGRQSVVVLARRRSVASLARAPTPTPTPIDHPSPGPAVHHHPLIHISVCYVSSVFPRLGLKRDSAGPGQG